VDSSLYSANLIFGEVYAANDSIVCNGQINFLSGGDVLFQVSDAYIDITRNKH